jgi:hypothetical protein
MPHATRCGGTRPSTSSISNPCTRSTCSSQALPIWTESSCVEGCASPSRLQSGEASDRQWRDCVKNSHDECTTDADCTNGGCGSELCYNPASDVLVQSNGKIERWHKTLKATTIRPKAPTSLDEARRIVGAFVEHYNTVRLHSAIGYVTPADKLAGREQAIWNDRDRKLEAARELRRQRRADAKGAAA